MDFVFSGRVAIGGGCTPLLLTIIVLLVLLFKGKIVRWQEGVPASDSRRGVGTGVADPAGEGDDWPEEQYWIVALLEMSGGDRMPSANRLGRPGDKGGGGLLKCEWICGRQGVFLFVWLIKSRLDCLEDNDDEDGCIT